MYYPKLLNVLLACVPFAAAHGGGMFYIMDGVNHTGTYPSIRNNETGSIQRDWSWNGVSTLNDPGITCNNPGTPLDISYHAPVTAGSTITIDYTIYKTGWTFGHPYGPMLAYLARCPDTGCEDVDLDAKIWFKIFEAGLLEGTWVDGHWAMRDIMEGAFLEVPTPASLRPGKYILKHDMVNLQTGPLQLFPNCVHLEVSGDGDSLPDEQDLVSFPAGYEDDVEKSLPGNNGNYWFYVEHASDTVYPIPGPPVWEG